MSRKQHFEPSVYSLETRLSTGSHDLIWTSFADTALQGRTVPAEWWTGVVVPVSKGGSEGVLQL